MPKSGDLDFRRSQVWDDDLGRWQPLWLRPGTVLHAVRRLFGLPAHALDYLGNGFMNRSWLVTTDDGERYVVRVSRAELSREQIEYEHALAAAWHEWVEPVVAPLPGVDGRTVQVEDGWRLSLFPFVEGVVGTKVDQEVRTQESAVTLARLHRVAVDELDFGQRPEFHAVHESPRWLWHEVRPVLEQKLHSDPEYRRLAGAIDREVAALDPWLDRLTTEGSLGPVAPVHGDFNPRNLLFRDNRLAGIVDFDACHLDAIVAEVAGVGFGDPDLDPPAFFRAYLDAGGPLDAGAFGLLGGFARIGCLSEVQWSVDDGAVHPEVHRQLTAVVDGLTWLRDRERDLCGRTDGAG
ncbi:phosphotransferase enzyme family protein [Flindersiella endophytica]